MKELVLNALRNLPDGQSALWMLYESKNLYKLFKELDMYVDNTAIPDSVDHRLSDTLENLFNQATMEIARVGEYYGDIYPLYDFLFTEVQVAITPYEKGKSQYWVITIDNVEHLIYWRRN